MKVGDWVRVADNYWDHLSDGWPSGEVGEVIIDAGGRDRPQSLVRFHGAKHGHSGPTHLLDGAPREHWWVDTDALTVVKPFLDPAVTEMVNDYVRGLEVVK